MKTTKAIAYGKMESSKEGSLIESSLKINSRNEAIMSAILCYMRIRLVKGPFAHIL